MMVSASTYGLAKISSRNMEFDDVFTSPHRQCSWSTGRQGRIVRNRSLPALTRAHSSYPAYVTFPSTWDVNMSTKHGGSSPPADLLEDMFGIVSDEEEAPAISKCLSEGSHVRNTQSRSRIGERKETNDVPLLSTTRRSPAGSPLRVGQNLEMMSTTLDKSASDSPLCSSAKLRHICLEYPVAQLQEATKMFHESRRLGSGAAGTVYRGTMTDGSDVAVKMINPRTVASTTGFEEEIITLSKFRHPNLVVLMGWARAEAQRFLVYEYLDGGSVQQRLRTSMEVGNGSQVFSWDLRLSVMRDAATGLAHLHNMRPRAFHRDIKSANIMIGSGGAKLVDFGLSCVATNLHESNVKFSQSSGTPGYACPTYVRSGRVTEGSEVYSFGVVLYEIVLNIPPAQITNGQLTFPLQQAIRTESNNANVAARCVELADVQADWPAPVSLALSILAVACTNQEDDSRPSCTDVCRKLREIQQSSLTCSIGNADSQTSKSTQEAMSVTHFPTSVVQIAAHSLPPPFTLLCTTSRCLSRTQLEQLPRSARILEASCAQAKLSVGLDVQTASFWNTVLPDPRLQNTVAKHHFQIVLGSSGFCLKNQSSAGTLLNGSRVYDQARIEPGSSIAISTDTSDNDQLEIVSFCLAADMMTESQDNVDNDQRHAEKDECNSATATTADGNFRFYPRWCPAKISQANLDQKESPPDCGTSAICAIS